MMQTIAVSLELKRAIASTTARCDHPPHTQLRTDFKAKWLAQRPCIHKLYKLHYLICYDHVHKVYKLH